MNAENKEKLLISAVFDNEEVGSLTKQGADSTFLTDTVRRIASALNIPETEWLRKMPDSFMLSADNAHAVHPNYTEKCDQTNRCYLNGGIVIKYSANQKYTTDSVSAAVFGEICRKAEVPVMMGFTGAPMPNDGVCVNRIQKVKGWIPHLKKLHIGAVYFSPVFESDNHGYDTRDFTKIDCRLGTNEDFKAVCDALHENGIKVVLDGVFNHVGRGFFAFRDVQEKKWDSPYKDWFHLNFDGNSAYNDGFWYEGWEGHYELVKLNLYNPTVVEYLLNCVGRWIDEFGIDGLRLDVAYMLNEDFMRRLRAYCDGKKPEFVLIGEMIHGDYNRITADGLLHSVTNYECYKGLYSAFNSMNLFEIAHSLGRQFGPEPWTLYRGKHLMNFADNHDVTRIASILNDEKQIYPLCGVLFAMPGIPCLYYGSEWGAKGEKHEGDSALRPCFDAPVENELTAFIERLAKVKTESRALNYGDYKNITIQNKNLLFERHCDHETVFVAVNAENAPCSIDARGEYKAVDFLTGETSDIHGRVELPPYGVKYLKLV